jgi:DnaJ-class molecular chaperone
METVSCEECGGTGTDPGSLREPEECIECKGTGKRIPFESCFATMRKDVGRELFHAMQERRLRDAS